MTIHETHLSSATLADLEARLEAERQALAEAIADGQPDDVDPLVARSAVVEAEQRLAEVEAALERFRDGTYGACVSCGEAIPSERLDALPATASCVDCAALAPSRLAP
jgi:RNA polymerase-binding transcription factor DksA